VQIRPPLGLKSVRFGTKRNPFMWPPRSIRLHLAAVFLLFFALVAGLGAFSMWRLANFNSLSADVAQVWLPTTRALGDLNNYTSDFRAFEGSALLTSDATEVAATEKQMAELDREIAAAERNFERIRRDPEASELYEQFKARWNAYRSIVNQMLVFFRSDRKDEALQIYGNSSRLAYNAASDALGKLTDQSVTSAQVASDRLAVAYRHAYWLILLAIIVAAVLVVGALVHISRSISAPLLALAGRMRRLAANDTDIDIPATDRQDEIGAMAAATVVFRNNAIELMRSQATLARQAALLEEQLAHEQRLALMQRNFVSMASHEFRTPMTVIDGHARRLDKTKETIAPGEIGERAGKIRSAVLRMTQLIENLLNSSRLIDGGAGLYINPAPMDIKTLLQEVCQLHREMVPGLQIVERVATAPVPMVGDAKLLFQAFSNILSNAVKYSPSGGAIEVTMQSAPGEVAVAISDQGIGIPAADLEHLFERYHRGSNVSGIVGTGVGLYLVKTAVDLHRGTVEVESVDGAGSRFTVRLPRAALTAAVSAPSEPTAVAVDA
jgi:two-component system, OmpR family, sensor kinase